MATTMTITVDLHKYAQRVLDQIAIILEDEQLADVDKLAAIDNLMTDVREEQK